MSVVAVLDYQVGNVFSVGRALEAIGVTPLVTQDRDEILSADRLIVPGVGAYGKAMAQLRQFGLDDTIRAFIAGGRPMLGICVGAQILLDEGREFGSHNGLGVIPGVVDAIPAQDASGAQLILPHIAWSTVIPSDDEGGLARWQASPFAALTPDVRELYFVHSFRLQPRSREHVIATTGYCGHEVVAAIAIDNVLGVQFHPERSGQAGLRFLARWAGA